MCIKKSRCSLKLSSFAIIRCVRRWEVAMVTVVCLVWSLPPFPPTFSFSPPLSSPTLSLPNLPVSILSPFWTPKSDRTGRTLCQHVSVCMPVCLPAPVWTAVDPLFGILPRSLEVIQFTCCAVSPPGYGWRRWISYCFRLQGPAYDYIEFSIWLHKSERVRRGRVERILVSSCFGMIGKREGKNSLYLMDFLNWEDNSNSRGSIYYIQSGRNSVNSRGLSVKYKYLLSRGLHSNIPLTSSDKLYPQYTLYIFCLLLNLSNVFMPVMQNAKNINHPRPQTYVKREIHWRCYCHWRNANITLGIAPGIVFLRSRVLPTRHLVHHVEWYLGREEERKGDEKENEWTKIMGDFRNLIFRKKYMPFKRLKDF